MKRINGHILVITNDPAWREMSCQLLSGLGLEVTIAQNGYESFFILEKNGYDLALLETSLPDMNGIEVLRLMKIRHPKLPVLVCLSEVDVDSLSFEKIFKLGAQGLMKKDRTSTELVPVIMSLMIIMGLKKSSEKPPHQATSFMLSNLH